MWRVAGAFLLALVGADTVASMAMNWLRSPEFVSPSLQSLWLDTSAGPEALEAVVLAITFGIAGAVLAGLLPMPFAKPVPALALGAAYSLFLYLFLPWLPGARGTVQPIWLPVLASAPYYVPAVAGAAGAAITGLIARRKSGQHAT
jgi:hypothetical protein